MIKVVAKSTYQGDCIPKVIELYGELIEKSRLESGCLSYELFQDTKNDSILTMIEEWESESHLAAHQKTEHFMRILPVISQDRLSFELNIYHKIG